MGSIWGLPKIRGTILVVPIIRTIVYWGLYWGPLILGSYHIGVYVAKQVGFGVYDLGFSPLLI